MVWLGSVWLVSAKYVSGFIGFIRYVVTFRVVLRDIFVGLSPLRQAVLVRNPILLSFFILVLTLTVLCVCFQLAILNANYISLFLLLLFCVCVFSWPS